MPCRESSGLRAVSQAQLLEDVSHVGLDRRLRHDQALSDFSVTQSLGEPGEHLTFAGTELEQRIVGAVAPGELREQPGGHARSNAWLALTGVEHCLHELGRRHVLEKVAGGSHSQGGPEIRLVI